MPTDGPLPSFDDFENDPLTPTTTPTLTPRPRRTSPPDPTPPDPAAAPPGTDAAAGRGDVPGTSPPATTEPSTGVGEGPPRRRGRPQTRPASQTATGFTRASNVQVPADLLAQIKARRAREGLTTGELIIAAIEATADRLPDLVATRPVTGGGLFSARVSHANRAAEPLTSLNFRMRVEDFDVLDDLVTRFKATSRSQLVTAALSDYLSRGT